MYKKIFLLIIFLLLSASSVIATSSASFFNPMGTGTSASSTFDEMFTRVLSWLFPISIIVAVLMIIIGAYYLILSGGDPQKAATGRKVITYALIGVTIVAISKGIVSILRTVFPANSDPLMVIPNVIDWIFGFLIVVVTGTLILSGYLFMISIGNPEGITKARRWLVYSLVGLAIAVVSRGLVAVVLMIIEP
ncbi:MAG: hypothetical protein U9Q96_00135 [Patescibacteria group bacterium]|nr:hypothetical protein [Patescibacteria group bacterium]